MKKTIVTLIVLVFLVLLVGGGWWWQAQAQAASAPAGFESTGVLEARKASLAAEIGGKVLEVRVEAGQHVTPGQALVILDDTLLQNQKNQAQAALKAAQANLDLLKAGATEEQIAAAQAQLAQANANLAAAQSGLSSATGESRPEDIAAARSFLDQARTNYYSMSIPLADEQIETLRSLSSAIDDKLAEAEGRLTSLKADTHNPESDIEGAQATIVDLQQLAAYAKSAQDAAQDTAQPNYRQIELVRLVWETGQSNVTAAQSRLDSLAKEPRTTDKSKETAQAALDDSRSLVDKSNAAYQAFTTSPAAAKLAAAWQEVQRAEALLAGFGISPLAASTTSPLPVETMLNQVDIAAAGRDLAAANLNGLKRGARQEQIDAAQAQVELAEAQLQAIDEQIKKLTITAPWDGVVLARSVEPGETALPGGTLLEIGKLDTLELTVYLPEDRLDLAKLDQTAEIQADAYAEQTFTGKVIQVADQAEFTPTNVQTKEDRSKLVYAIVMRVDNPDLLLKPGMIVDITFKK